VERDRGDAPGPHLVGVSLESVELAHPGGLDPARHHTVHPDAVGAELVGELLGDHGQPGAESVGGRESW
jgi:hypothetical protein